MRVWCCYFGLLLLLCFFGATNGGGDIALCIVGEVRSFTVPFVHKRTKANLIDSLGSNGTNGTVFLLLKTPLAARASESGLPGIYERCGESKNCRWEVEMLRNASAFIEPHVLRYIHPKKNRIDDCNHVGNHGQTRVGKENFGLRGEYKMDRLEAFLGQLVGWDRCLTEVEKFEANRRGGRPFDAIVKARPDSLWFEKVDFSGLDLSSAAYLGDFWPGFRKSLDLKHEANYAGCNQSFLLQVKAGMAHAPSETSGEQPLWRRAGRRPPQANESYVAFGSAQLLGTFENGTRDGRTGELNLQGNQVRVIAYDVDLKLYKIEPLERGWALPPLYDALIPHDALYRPSKCSSESIKRAADAATAVNPFNGSWTRPSDHFFVVPRRLGMAALGYMREYNKNCSGRSKQAVIMKQMEWLLYTRLAVAGYPDGIKVRPHWFPEVIASPKGIGGQGDNKRVTQRTRHRRKQNGWCARFYRDGNSERCTSFVDSIKIPVAPIPPTRPPTFSPTPLPTDHRPLNSSNGTQQSEHAPMEMPSDPSLESGQNPPAEMVFESETDADAAVASTNAVSELQQSPLTVNRQVSQSLHRGAARSSGSGDHPIQDLTPELDEDTRIRRKSAWIERRKEARRRERRARGDERG